MRIAIARRLLEQIFEQAARSPDREICGLLFGDSMAILEARATPNVADDPAHAFEVDPRMLLTAMKAERTGGPRMIGHYHSHPNGRAEPSDRDAEAAEAGTLWLIVGGRKATLWKAEAGGQFRAVVIDITA